MARNAKEQGVKAYCFDPATHLLRAVIYRVAGVPVETRFTNWKQVGDQTVPGTIVRLENNLTVFTLTIISDVFTPKAADGLLSMP